MEDISADDDLLGDMLLDSLEFDPPISTHKMNYTYRSPRFDTSAVINLVRNRVVIERDVPRALDELCEMPVIRRHLQSKSDKQKATFYAHAKRYLEAYLPDAGFEFALTYRYQRATAPVASSLADGSSIAESSAAGAAQAAADAAAATAAAAKARPTKPRRSGGNDPSRGTAPSTAKADICVIAVRSFKPGEYIMCKGGLTDLTKAEDEALRNEAAASRQALTTQPYGGVLGQGRDFSIIKSSARNCSQLLLGPSRFVNHDCDPNVEFSRNGHSMKFKVLRPIAINEEILVGYGEHYFGWQNCECLCATCESKGRGAFLKEGVQTMQEREEQTAAVKASLSSSEAESSNGGSSVDDPAAPRRALSKRIKTRRESPNGNGNGSATALSSNMSAEEYANRSKSRSSSRSSILNSVVPSDRELIDPMEARGPKCKCLTCDGLFFAPESWWLPDECSRCERHYRIFKADWPGRTPTEGAFAARSQQVSRQQQQQQAAAESQRGGAATNGHSAAAKGKGKAAANQVGELVKAKGGRLSGGSAGGGRKSNVSPAPVSSAASTSSTLSSLADSSASATPIRLSPMRTFEEREDPTPRKGKLKATAAQGSTDSSASSAAKPPTRKSSKPIPPPSDDSASSDLTDPSGPALASANGLDSTDESNSSASSSSSDAPCGPKMLGKSAKTETLAQYWGALEGEGRRARKPSVNGPVSLASKAALKAGATQRRRSSSSMAGGSGSQLHGGHRRTASRTSVFYPDSDEEEELQDGDAAGERKRKRATAGPVKSNEASSSRRPSNGNGRSSGSADTSGTVQQQQQQQAPGKESASPVKARGQESVAQPFRPAAGIPAAAPSPIAAAAAAAAAPPSHSASPAPSTTSTSAHTPSGSAPPTLATHGAERTSIKNLAAFWSAGVESGSRTRRQAQREPTTLVQATGAPRRTVSGGVLGERQASGSRSPQPAARRGRKRRGSEEASDPQSAASSPAGAAAGYPSRPSSVGAGSEASTSASASVKRLKSASKLAGASSSDFMDDDAGRTRSPLVVEAALGGNVTPASSHRPLKASGAVSSPSYPHDGPSGNSPQWPGVVMTGSGSSSSSNGLGLSPAGGSSPSAPGAGGPRVYQGIPGRKNLRIGRPGSVSRPLPVPMLAPGVGGAIKATASAPAVAPSMAVSAPAPAPAAAPSSSTQMSGAPPPAAPAPAAAGPAGIALAPINQDHVQQPPLPQSVAPSTPAQPPVKEESPLAAPSFPAAAPSQSAVEGVKKEDVAEAETEAMQEG